MAPTLAAKLSQGDSWSVEDITEVIRGIGSALISRLDDHDLLVKLNERAEMTFRRVDELKGTIEMRQANHDDRLRALEQARWMMLGAAAAFGAIASVVVQFIKH
jgi:hypothetical protein